VLFDLRSGKRRRAVQIVYSLLAVSFLIGFVFFGVGTGGLGSISDIFGGGGSSSGSLSSQYDDQINAANARLAKDPRNEQALLRLAKYEYLKGKQGITQDPTTGQPSVSQDAHTELGRAADAWTKYLRVTNKPDATVAALLVNAFIFLNDASGAARTEAIVAADQPSQNSYGTLAIFRYLGGDIPAGDAAAKKAENLAPKSVRKQVSKQLATYRKQGLKLKKQQAKAAKSAPPPTTPGANPLQSPFGGVGGP
jgi:hypothetical protein